MSQIDKLKKQQEQLRARIQKLEAAEKTRERKRDVRRKILVGAYFLDKYENEKRMPQLVKALDGYLKRDSDRTLFDLKPLREL